MYLFLNDSSYEVEEEDDDDDDDDDDEQETSVDETLDVFSDKNNHNHRYSLRCPMIVEGRMFCCCAFPFLENVNSRSLSLYVVVRPSVCRLSSVCNIRAPYLGD